MKSMADFGPTLEWDQLRVRGSKRKKILESHSTKSNAFLPNIAVEADCTQGYVSRVLKAKLTAEQPHQPAEPEAEHGEPKGFASWFQSIVETNIPDLKDALRASLRETPAQMRWTTNVEDPSRIRHITARELKGNTFPYDLNTTDKDEIKRGTEWLRYHFSGEKKSAQGFVIMDAHSGSDCKPSEALFNELPKLLDEPNYTKKFSPIFQKLQAKDAAKTKGDSKRRQAKMTDLAEKAQQRVEEATVLPLCRCISRLSSDKRINERKCAMRAVAPARSKIHA